MVSAAAREIARSSRASKASLCAHLLGMSSDNIRLLTRECHAARGARKIDEATAEHTVISRAYVIENENVPLNDDMLSPSAAFGYAAAASIM